MSACLFTTEYFGPISSFRIMNDSNEVWVEKNENYQKKSYRNRCFISSPDGKQMLSIPLKSGKNKQTPITKVEISYDNDWMNLHLNAMSMGYANAPYYMHYIDDIRDILLEHHDYLYDLNCKILSYTLETLWMDDVIMYETKDYHREYDNSEVIDMRNEDYIKRMKGRSQMVYTQPFDDKYDFNSDLSILDLIFCLGPEAGLYVRNIWK